MSPGKVEIPRKILGGVRGGGRPDNGTKMNEAKTERAAGVCRPWGIPALNVPVLSA